MTQSFIVKKKSFEFSKKISYLGIFGWNLKKTIAIFVISTLEFFNMRSLNLDEIYEKKAKGIRIRSKCNWYEHGEKSTKFF